MYHPDVTHEAEPGKFGKIAEAYDVLSDPSKRRMYDASLSFKWDGGREGTQRGGGNSAGDGWTEGEWQEVFYRRGTNPDGGYGRYAESDLKRRAREAQEAAQRAEDEKAWWEFEKTHAERMKVQFRANAARARGSHAVRQPSSPYTLAFPPATTDRLITCLRPFEALTRLPVVSPFHRRTVDPDV